MTTIQGDPQYLEIIKNFTSRIIIIFIINIFKIIKIFIIIIRNKLFKNLIVSFCMGKLR